MSEDAPATGYGQDSIGGDCAANGTITLAAGDNKTCTITNNDNAPSLTLNKIVTNNNGGAQLESAWTLTATGPTTLSGSGASGSTDVVSGASFHAGTYTLSESGPSGYSSSDWSCTNGVTVNGSNQITLSLGQTTVCTITNDDTAPTLTLVKSVTTTGDPAEVPPTGTEWTLQAAGDQTISGASGSGAVTGATVNAGSYTLSESGGPAHYAQSGGWNWQTVVAPAVPCRCPPPAAGLRKVEPQDRSALRRNEPHPLPWMRAASSTASLRHAWQGSRIDRAASI